MLDSMHKYHGRFSKSNPQELGASNTEGKETDLGLVEQGLWALLGPFESMPL